MFLLGICHGARSRMSNYPSERLPMRELWCFCAHMGLIDAVLLLLRVTVYRMVPTCGGLKDLAKVPVFFSRMLNVLDFVFSQLVPQYHPHIIGFTLE